MKRLRTGLNCDLGEGEPPRRTETFFKLIASASAACGGHAGSAVTMRRCARLAKTYDVRLGAHPGLKTAFGRAESETISPDELETLLIQQISALETIAKSEKVRLHHVKLHGALYHLTEKSGPLRKRYLQTIQAHWPKLAILCLSGGKVAKACKNFNLRAIEEVFADRAYSSDGSLVPRSQPNALLISAAEIRERFVAIYSGGHIMTVTGKRLRRNADTICVHSDSPGTIQIMRLAAKALENGHFPGRRTWDSPGRSQENGARCRV